MKTSIEHYNVGAEVYVVSTEFISKDVYYNISIERVKSITISNDGVEYWFENWGEVSQDIIFEGLDEAFDYVKSKMTEDLSNEEL